MLGRIPKRECAFADGSMDLYLTVGAGGASTDTVSAIEYDSSTSIAKKRNRHSRFGFMDDLLSLQDMRGLAKYLGVDPGRLYAYCYHQVPEAYQSFKVRKKSGGFRDIDQPADELMIIQRLLARSLLSLYTPHHAVHSFVQGRNVLTNAICHVDQSWVFKADIKDFFPSIKIPVVARTLEHAGLSRNVAVMVANLCTNEGSLPQGAPTSPVLSNMVFQRCDMLITQLCSRLDCVYTRYADDLTISHSRLASPDEIYRTSSTLKAKILIGDELSGIIEGHGFQVNIKKLRLLGPRDKQEVVGVLVNPYRLSKVNASGLDDPTKSSATGTGPVSLSRVKLRFIRSALHALTARGIPEAESWYAKHVGPRRGKKSEAVLQKHLAGSLGYAVMINGCRHKATAAYIKQFRTVYPGVGPNFEAIDNYRRQTLADRGNPLLDQKIVGEKEYITFERYLKDNGVIDFDTLDAKNRERLLSLYCANITERLGYLDVSKDRVLEALCISGRHLDEDTICDLAYYLSLRRMRNAMSAAMLHFARAVENELHCRIFTVVQPFFANNTVTWTVREPEQLVKTLRGVRDAAHNNLTLGQYPYLAEALRDQPRIRVLSLCRKELVRAFGSRYADILASVIDLRTRKIIDDHHGRASFIQLRNKACHPRLQRWANIRTIDEQALQAAEISIMGSDGLLNLLACAPAIS